MPRIENTQKLHARLDRYDQKRYSAEREKLREEFLISEKCYSWLKELKRKLHPASSTSNLSKTYLTSIKIGHL